MLFFPSFFPCCSCFGDKRVWIMQLTVRGAGELVCLQAVPFWQSVCVCLLIFIVYAPRSKYSASWTPVPSDPLPSPSPSSAASTSLMIMLELILDKLTSYSWILFCRASSSTAKNRGKPRPCFRLVQSNKLSHYLGISLIKYLLIILFKETWQSDEMSQRAGNRI